MDFDRIEHAKSLDNPRYMAALKASAPKAGYKIVTLPKVKPPFIGIPIPGQRPFLVRTELFMKACRNTRVVSWEVAAPNMRELSSLDYDAYRSEKPTTRRILRIEHHTGNVKGRMAFYEAVIGYQERKEIQEWKEKQAKRKTSPPAVKPHGERAKVIARLEKELAGMYLTAPYNPLLPAKCHTHERTELPKPMQCIFALDGKPCDGTITATGTPRLFVQSCDKCSYTNTHRHSMAEWHFGKPLRKALAKVTAFALTNPTKRAEAYKLVEKIARIHYTYAKRGKKYENLEPSDFWKRLPEMCGFDKPYEYRKTFRENTLAEQLERHAGARRAHAEKLREAESLRSQIANLKAGAAE